MLVSLKLARKAGRNLGKVACNGEHLNCGADLMEGGALPHPQIRLVGLVRRSKNHDEECVVSRVPSDRHLEQIGAVIPKRIDQNPWAHWRSPSDMMRQG